MKRLLLLLALVVTLGIASFSPVSATVASVTLDPKADLSDSRISAVATGTIVCDAGMSVDITVIIIQSSGKTDSTGTGTGTEICTGQVQTWSATVNVLLGAEFKHGPAVALFAATTEDGESSATLSQGIKL
jgi:hypothetical protein